MALSPELSHALDGPDWLKQARSEAASQIESTPMPSSEQELWRYSRVSDIDIDSYQVPEAGDGQLSSQATELLADIGESTFTVVLIDGVVSRIDPSPAAETKGVTAEVSGSGEFAPGVDIFGVLNAAFATPVVISIPNGKVVEAPIVVVNHVTQSGVAVFPRLLIRAGEASQARVIELFTSSGENGLVSSVVQHQVAQAANLDYVNVQLLDTSIHQVGYNVSRVAQDAHFSSTTVTIGGDYARVRTDSFVEGKGGEAKLRAVYFASESQMHDFRTLQHHDGPKTTSDLFFKGAVADRARSVYSGLIRVEKGAAGTNAFQTNRNLVLSDGAQAESVPNLEIEENDVKCSHASATGPIDEEHRYYLETRGVPTEVANRLIAKGFLDEVLDEVGSDGLRAKLSAIIGAKLDDVKQVISQ